MKESEMKNIELDKEIHALEQIQKNQEKELEKNSEGSEGNNKIKTLNQQLKATKEKNKELEKKIQTESASYQKQHNQMLDLQEKLQELRKEKIRWKKAIAEGLPCPPDENQEEDGKKSDEDVLKTSVLSLKKRLELEKINAKKTAEAQKNEIASLQMKIKEAEQENKLNSAKLSDLKKQMRHNQLTPLNEPGAEEIKEVGEAKNEDSPRAINEAQGKVDPNMIK